MPEFEGTSRRALRSYIFYYIVVAGVASMVYMITHEGIHLVECNQHNMTVQQFCFVGYDYRTNAVGWVQGVANISELPTKASYSGNLIIDEGGEFLPMLFGTIFAGIAEILLLIHISRTNTERKAESCA